MCVHKQQEPVSCVDHCLLVLHCRLHSRQCNVAAIPRASADCSHRLCVLTCVCCVMLVTICSRHSRFGCMLRIASVNSTGPTRFAASPFVNLAEVSL
jgi:hypothetical protein